MPASMTSAGIALVIEMSYRLAAKAADGPAMTFLTIPLAADRPVAWLSASALAIGGFALFRLTWPLIAAAWATAELRKADALMVLPYNPKRVEEAARHFDETVRLIQAREFTVTTPPEATICKECDLRMLCHAEGIISREARG
jgi:hypothetical protein